MKNHHILALCLPIYFIQLILKFNSILAHSWINQYLADFLCLPVMLAMATILIRKIQNRPDFELNSWMICGVWIYVSLMFEAVLPSFSKRYTTDLFDVGMYAIGGMVYYLTAVKINKTKPPAIPSNCTSKP